MSQVSNLYERVHYKAPIDYIIDSTIYEYDIRKANISVLYDKGTITKEFYERMLVAPKNEREIAIGKMQINNKPFSDALRQGIQDARQSLFQILELDETNVLAIRNDAIFVVKTCMKDYPQEIQVGPHTTFVRKNIYRSFYNYFGRSMFYYFDPISSVEGLDVKGLGEYAINLHRDYLLRTFMDIFYTAITAGPQEALEFINKFYDAYIKKQLPLEYYRRFDSHAQFDFRNISNWCTFRADFLTPGAAEDMIDISYNASILRLFSSYYLSEVLKQNKR